MSNTVKEKVFKIMDESCHPIGHIPLRVVLPHAQQAYDNHMQSLATLDARGGLSPKEMLHVLLDRRWGRSDESNRIQRLSQEEAMREIRSLVRERFPRLLEEEVAHMEAARGQCQHDRPDRLVDSVGVKKCPHCGCLVSL